MKKNFYTKQGLKDLKEKTEKIISQRPLAVLDLKNAREMGDLSENGYYKAAKFKLNDIDRTIRRNNYLIKNAEVKEPKDSNSVQIGLTVVLDKNGKRKSLKIVGSYESNPEEGRISYLSPVGKQLLDGKVGEKIRITVGENITIYTIKSINY
ncbi:MAG TPA: GreA/GreB family elongation factor [Patescibacteria group bacterium]|nr:GreA/GreB family elongation factor [Patescibacteria group bacterium]